MTRIKNIIQEFLKWQWTLWILFLFLYTWKLKSNLMGVQSVLGVSINLWDFMLEFFVNPLLFIYFLFPIFLISFCKTILQNGEYMILLRLHSYKRWIFFMVGKVIPPIIVFLFIWVLVSLIVSLPSPLQLSWSEYATNDFGMNYLVFELQQYFIHPYIAVLLQIIQYFAFLITVHVVISTFYLIWPKNSTLIILASSIYFLTIITYKMFNDWDWIQISNYIFTYYSITDLNSAYLPLLFLFIIFISCLLIINLFKK
ncbi:hypothetical protein [Robertmurraya andreesenii]|uniref:ABC transporter permease n=1 Tax=Anoxybacillus andreesenii TaxID=1325932 RepID=A0ABT9V8V8_9BACL|nr:hypothetical protein [Robertmurraya andreesenii]MDQ0157379.1 hypothetical protein [Robertmurraya andreesenii]